MLTSVVIVVLGDINEWHSLGQVLPDKPQIESVDQIPADKDRMMQPMGCVGPTPLQVPLDGMHMEVRIFH